MTHTLSRNSVIPLYQTFVFRIALKSPSALSNSATILVPDVFSGILFSQRPLLSCKILLNQIPFTLVAPLPKLPSKTSCQEIPSLFCNLQDSQSASLGMAFQNITFTSRGKQMGVWASMVHIWIPGQFRKYRKALYCLWNPKCSSTSF